MHALLLIVAGAALAADKSFASCTAPRPLPVASQRAMATGPAKFVDAAKGADTGDGSKERPWRTVNHALTQIGPGDTLYLRGGVYYENVYCSAAGTKHSPITLRSYPGELVTIDGGLREFAEDPAKAWESCADGVAGEYRSTKVYRNIRDVHGRFGDSLAGLQTYWHREDLQADNEQWIPDPAGKSMVLPVYCGPGLWYDRISGRIHVRLAHTHINQPLVTDYRGESDPRKLSLVVAQAGAMALHVDQGMHLRFQDLSLRGGGFNTVVLNTAVNVEFDNVAIYAGTYGIRSRGTGPLKMTNSSVQGCIPPWGFRDENSLYTYTPLAYDPFLPAAGPSDKPPGRNIARLPTHALIVTEGSYEFEVFHYPYNHDWELSNCEFTDGHDGVYLSGRNIRFHHNWVDNIQDDAIYLSSPSPHFSDNIYVYQNLLTRALMAFSCNSTGGPDGNVYLFRNVVDYRIGVNFSRPSPKAPEGKFVNFHVYLKHGGQLLGMESLYFYQNTFICPATGPAYAGYTYTATTERSKRRVFNNLFVYTNAYPAPVLVRAALHDIQIDGNLHWCPLPDAKLPADYLKKAQTCPASEHNKDKYPDGWESHALVADPGFMAFSLDPRESVDFRLKKDSPALAHGVELPTEWEDPLRKPGVKPDLGALPLDSELPKYGRFGRLDYKLPNDAGERAPSAAEKK